jgi:hypothetical protein
MGAGYADQPADVLEMTPGLNDYSYVGVDGCKMCHRSPAKGNQFGKWEEAAHSRAYTELASDKAKEIAAEKGVGDPQTAAACLKCHVTGHDAPADRKAKTYKAEDGVGCESCHGPGSAYKAMAVMRDHQKSVDAGMLVPDENTCKSCHNEESPTFKGFNFEEAFKAIAHPNPQGK